MAGLEALLASGAKAAGTADENPEGEPRVRTCRAADGVEVGSASKDGGPGSPRGQGKDPAEQGGQLLLVLTALCLHRGQEVKGFP